MVKYGNRLAEAEQESTSSGGEQYDAGSNAENSPEPNHHTQNTASESGDIVDMGTQNGNGGSHKDEGGQHVGTNGSQSNRRLEFTNSTQRFRQKVAEVKDLIQAYSELCRKYEDDIEEAPKLRQKLLDLEADIRERDVREESTLNEKNGKIMRQKAAIDELQERLDESKRESEQQKAAIKKEQSDLDERKRDFEEWEKNERKLLEERDAEQRADLERSTKEQKEKLENDFHELKERQDQEFQLNKQNLEEDFAKQKAENDQKVEEFETANTTLTSSLDEAKKQIEDKEAQVKKLEDEREDLLDRIESLKRDKKLLKQRLHTLENEFSLTSQPIEFYRDSFSEIEKTIRQIASQYIKEVDSEDRESTRQDLMKVDTHFQSVPISDSEESRSLCMAHAQRIISSYIVDIIWQPFSSEKTSEHKEFSNFLAEIYTGLATKPDPNGTGRAPIVFRTLTIRELRSMRGSSLSAPPPSPPASPGTSFGSSKVTSTGHSTLASKFVEGVLGILKPLIDPTQQDEFQKALSSLAQVSESVWTSAQTDILEIQIISRLDQSRRDDWRSHEYDPPSADGASDVATNMATHPRVFTLFPEIKARQLCHNSSDKLDDLSDSFPEPCNQPFQPVELSIHPGVGLAEWSPLVISGKEEVQEAEESLAQVTRERWMRRGRQSRKASIAISVASIGSTASTVGSPVSPSAQWTANGGTMQPDDDI